MDLLIALSRDFAAYLPGWFPAVVVAAYGWVAWRLVRAVRAVVEWRREQRDVHRRLVPR